MEKYRRWTDEATGINPFIKAKQQPIQLLQVLVSAVISYLFQVVAVLKLHVIIIFLVPIVISLLIESFVGNIPVIGRINKIPLKILASMIGLWGSDDSNFKKLIEKRQGKGAIILSNSLCILDVFYFLANLPNVKFIVSSPQEQKFEIIKGLNAILTVIASKQPFFNQKAPQNGQNLRDLLSRQLAQGSICVLFFEGIRTNGLGTIKISSKLSDALYSIQKDYISVYLKYTSAPEGLFETVSHPLVLFFVALGTWQVSLKVRSSPVLIGGLHSSKDLQAELDSFLQANAAKLLDTEPESYFHFLQFYYKSLQSGYTQNNKQRQE